MAVGLDEVADAEESGDAETPSGRAMNAKKGLGDAFDDDEVRDGLTGDGVMKAAA